MAIFVHLVNLAHWRWSSSVGLVFVACVPIAAATLFIPNEIEAPWGARASSALPRPAAQRTAGSERGDAALGGIESAIVTEDTLAAPGRRRATATAAHKVAQAHTESTRRTRGHFVPLGETDDARALEPREGAPR